MSDRNSKKKRLIRVWRDTVRISRDLYSKDLLPSEVIDITKFSPLKEPEAKYEDVSVRVVNMDTFTAAHRMVNIGLNPLVLNMASDFCPGGGVRKGSSAQEECMFRCSNYSLVLDKSVLPEDTYPLCETIMIYSSQVTVFKNYNYEKLQKPFKVSCLACPGIRKPRLNRQETDYHYQYDYDLMCNKVEGIFRIAYDKGHDSVLLGALGCGAFKNPPELVAEIFAEAVKKYKYCFKSIGFAVLSRGLCENFEVFKAVMERT